MCVVTCIKFSQRMLRHLKLVEIMNIVLDSVYFNEYRFGQRLL